LTSFQAVHEGLDCKQYQLSLLDEESQDENALKTRQWIEVVALKMLTCMYIDT
jgi:hypothetical protein